MKLLYILFISVALLASCGKEEKKAEDPHAGMPMQQQGMPMGGGQMGGTSEKPAVKADGVNLEFSNVKMQVPANWVNEPPMSEMRIVQYFLKNDNSVNVIGFYFGNQPDMAEANIQRWKDEFTKVDDSKTDKLAGGKCNFVSITGTYKKKPFPMAQDFVEVEGYMTVAAIVESKDGPYYFKMVGPKKTLTQEISSFKTFLNSYKAL